MSQPLNILILEDNPADAELVQFELEEAGFVFTSKVVMTEQDFIRELQEFCPDLILSDYDLPKYTGAQALAEVRKRCPDIPFILVTGAVTEDRAIDILTQGAKDYVLKNRLQQRLVPAVRRALTEAEELRARKKAEAELQEAHSTLEAQVAERTAELRKQIERRRQVEEVILKYNKRLELLSYTAGRLLASDSPQQLVEELCRKVMEFLECDAFFNFLVDESAGRLHLNACAGIPAETARTIEWLEYGVAVCGCAARDSRRIVAENIPETPDVRTELVKSFGIKAYACHPLLEKNRVLGTLSFGTRSRTSFSSDDLATMKAVADQVAIAMARIRSEQALRTALAESERDRVFFEAVISAQNDVVIMYDSQRNVQRANPAFTEIYGFDPIGLHVTEIMRRVSCRSLDDRPLLLEAQPTPLALEGKKVTGLRFAVTRFDGSEGTVEVSSGPIQNGRHVIGAVTVWHDITERKKAEEQIASEKYLQQLLLDHFPGVVVLLRTKTREIVASNKAGSDVGAVCGSKCFETWGQSPDPCPWCLAPDLWATGKEQCTVIDAGEKVFEAHWVPVTDDLYMHYAFDITERKRAEEKLQEKDRVIQQALSISNSFAFDWDAATDQVHRSASCKRIFGSDGNEMCDATARLFSQRIHPDDRPRFEKLLRGLTPAADTYATDFRIVLSDGRVVTLSETAQAFFDAAGRIKRVIGVAQDITERKQAEEALKASEHRERERAEELANILDAVPSPVIIVHDADAAHMTGNRAADELLRQPHGAEVSLSAPPEARPRHFKAIKDSRELRLDELPAQRAARGEHVQDFEFSLVFDNGAIRHVLGYGTPLLNGQNQPRGAVHVLVDITERKQAEDALKASERTQRLLAQIGEIGVRLQSGEMIEAISECVAKELDVSRCGFSRVDLGAGQVTVLKDYHSHLSALTGVYPMAGYADYLEEGFAGRAVAFEDTAADPRTAPVYATNFAPIQVRAHLTVPLLRGGKWVANFWVSHHEPRHWTVTEVKMMTLIADRVWFAIERQRVDEELRQSEERFRIAVKNPSFTLSRFDRDLRYTWIHNPHPDFARSQLLGKRGVDLEDSEAMRRLNDLKLQVVETGKGVRDEITFGRSDGEHTYDIIVEPFFDDAGAVMGGTTSALDITGRKRAEEALREQARQLEDVNRDLESFSYSVSHDLRAPLRAITGYAQMILKKQGELFDEETRRRFRMITDSAETMNRLIDDLLAFSRLGSQAVTKGSLDMEKLIGEVWQELLTISPDREMTMEIGQIPAACGDRALIRQVYGNLLGNAVKFTQGRNPAAIEAGSCVQGSETVYYVRDNGIGFDMKYYDKLFGVFQRLHRDEEYKGTGIGLALVKRIVNRHGGRVWAEGKVDRGATFYFTLPTRQE